MDLWISTFESILQNLIRPLEWVMLFAVIGGGLYLCFHSKGYPLLKIKTAFGLLLSKEKNKHHLVHDLPKKSRKDTRREREEKEKRREKKEQIAASHNHRKGGTIRLSPRAWG